MASILPHSHPGLWSSCPKSELCHPKCLVKSPKMQSGGLRFYHTQQYPSIPITICCTCFVSLKFIEQDISLIYRACFFVNHGLKREIYYTFIPLVLSHHCLKNKVHYTFIALVLSHDGLKSKIH